MGGAFGRIARLLRRPTSEPGEPEPDAELLARFARSADQSAFELLVWRHAAMVLGVCRRAVRDHHLAEDAFQATFLVLARKAGSVRGTNVAGWLFGVARRVAARAAARTRARRETPLVAEPVAPAAAECSGELSAVLDEEVGRLPERLRLPVVLCYLGGRSTEDAARVIGCPRGTVLSRLATARRRLAARLTRRGVTVPAALLAVAAVPTGLGAVSGLVPGAVRVSLGQAANSSVAVLAQGVITAMNIGKTVTTAAVFILAGGLTLGLGVFTRTEGQSQPRPAATAPTQKPGEPAARAAAQPAPDRQFVRRQLESALVMTQSRLNEAIRRAWNDGTLGSEAEVEDLTQQLRKLRTTRRTLEVGVRARDAAIDGEIEAMPEIQALRAPLNAMHTHILNKQATGVKQDDPDLVNMKNEYRRAEQQLNDRRSKIRAQIETKYPIPKEVRAILDSATTTEQNVRQFADRYAQQLRHEEQVVMNVMRDANLARLRRREEADDIDTLLEVRKQLKRRLLLVELGDVDLTGQDGVAPSEAARLRQEVEELRAELKRLREAKKPE